MHTKGKDEARWYFAYGSNLDAERLEGRIGRTNVEWRLARLEGYRLSFDKPASDGSGYAMIARHEDDTVYGVLYALHEYELERLDTCEGVSNHYVRRTVDAITAEGDLIPVECYFAVSPSNGLLPRRKYLDLIIRGAKAHNLPVHHISHLEAVATFD